MSDADSLRSRSDAVFQRLREAVDEEAEGEEDDAAPAAAVPPGSGGDRPGDESGDDELTGREHDPPTEGGDRPDSVGSATTAPDEPATPTELAESPSPDGSVDTAGARDAAAEPSTTDPTTPDSATPDQAATDPTTPDSAAPDSGTPDPTAADLTTTEPATPDPVTTDPVTTDPAAPDSATPTTSLAEIAGEAATLSATLDEVANQEAAATGAPTGSSPPEPTAGSATGARRDAAGHALPRVLALANQKGGVGKTTTAVNLAAALAEAGYRTLVVDLDPQGNASTGLGINIRDLQLSMYDVIIHETGIEDTIEATAMKNLFVAPASLDLAGAEIELVPAFSRELRLRHALEAVADDYDYVLVDCPPSLGLLTVNGLAAAGEVLVPIQCEYYALEGLGQLLRNVSLVQRNLNRELAISTVVCVMYDARTKLADQVVAEVRDHFGDKACRIVIPRTVRLSEAPSYGQPILAFDPRSRGAIAYRELGREVSGGPLDPSS